MVVLQFVSDSADEKAYSTKNVGIASEEKIIRPEDVVTFFGSFFARKKQEYFCTLNLDGSGKVISARIITIGLLNHSLVHPREVFKDAILDSAASIICVHNHPSGTREPSPQDIEVTRQLMEAGTIIGIKVIDHIIIPARSKQYLSMKESGIF